MCPINFYCVNILAFTAQNSCSSKLLCYFLHLSNRLENPECKSKDGFIKYSVFKDLTSNSSGGAIYVTSFEKLGICSSLFLNCRTVSMSAYGGAIYIGGGSKEMCRLCGVNCSALDFTQFIISYFCESGNSSVNQTAVIMCPGNGVGRRHVIFSESGNIEMSLLNISQSSPSNHAILDVEKSQNEQIFAFSSIYNCTTDIPLCFEESFMQKRTGTFLNLISNKMTNQGYQGRFILAENVYVYLGSCVILGNEYKSLYYTRGTCGLTLESDCVIKRNNFIADNTINRDIVTAMSSLKYCLKPTKVFSFSEDLHKELFISTCILFAVK